MNRLVFGTLVLAVSMQAAVAANGFYVGGEIQLNKVQVDGGELGGGLSVGDFEGDQVGFDIFAGYRFHDTGNLLDSIAIAIVAKGGGICSNIH